MKTHAQVVVIGGGVMGCSLIYHLSKFGWNDVVLVEKNELTAGSTWHAAGLCTHYAHNITIMNLRAHSVKLYNGILEEETGQAVSFHATGALRVTTKKDRMDEFRHVQGIGKFAGHDFNILSPAELKGMYPLVNTEGLLGAIHEPCDGYVDPSQATHAMAKGARDRGAEIYRNNPVLSIKRVKNEWIVSTKNGDIHAEHIVNAAGTWCREIGLMMGVDLPVVPMLHQYMVMDRIESFANLEKEMPFIRDPDESWYLRQERDGVILGPYEKKGQPWAIDGVPPEFGMELLPPELERIEDIAADCMARVPAAGEGGIKNIVNGPITFTPDANPLIGPAFDLPNAWILTGSSMGIMEGGGSGQFLAQWMIGGEPPADALAIDSRRFGGYADRSYRVDKAVECFAAQFGIHYPYEERPAGRQKRTTPIYQRLKDLGAVFGSAYGWERPNWFNRSTDNADSTVKRETVESELSFQRCNWFKTVAEECRCAREDVAIADLSVFSKFRITGESADSFLASLGANSPPSEIGGIGLNHVLTESGGVASEFSVTKIDSNHYYLVCAAAAERHDEDLLRTRSQGYAEVNIQNVTEQLGVLGVMGPKAEKLLMQNSDVDFSQSSFPWLTMQQITVCGVAVTAIRVSYIGESGWELHHKTEDQLTLFESLWESGQALGIGLYGAFAMNAMRLEKGYRAWGSDYTTERTVLEAGSDLFTKTSSREFIGREALIGRKNRDDHWSMHLLELEDTGEDPFYSHTVFQNDEAVGMVTSGAFGQRVGKPLALAYFTEKMSDAPIFVEILGKKVSAKILRTMPYDPNNLKMKI
jgi:dimethylglycine dehydrogenase